MVLTNAVVNWWQDGPGTADGMRARVRGGRDVQAAERIASVDDATIERAIRGVGELYGRMGRHASERHAAAHLAAVGRRDLAGLGDLEFGVGGEEVSDIGGLGRQRRKGLVG